MNRSTQVIGASVLVGIVIALVWFKAPLVPALIGAAGAGLVLAWGSRRVSN